MEDQTPTNDHTRPASQANIIVLNARLDAITSQLASRGILLAQEGQEDQVSAGSNTSDDGTYASTNPNPTIKKFDIHPQGDVVFICKDDEGSEVRVRILSTIVSLGSPVFKAMLGPHSREGRTLRAGTEVEIPPPGENPAALVPILRAMHMCPRGDASRVSVSEMVDIAQICDKYDCVESIRATNHCELGLLGKWATQPKSEESLPYQHGSLPVQDDPPTDDEDALSNFYSDPAKAGDALVAAAVLKDAEHCSRIGGLILLHCREKIGCSPKGAALMPLLPVDIFGKSSLDPAR